MRVTICAVGRLRAGPEFTLVSEYLDRFGKSGRGLGLGPASVREVESKKGGGMVAEGKLLAAVLPENSVRVVLDERGKTLNSREFAELLRRWRDEGRRDCAFLIGGADGVEKGLRQEADIALSFGSMVWPHMLARVMLAEQLYRAASILSGSPYHRE
ncbi:23S rRNA (pseudouridine(1915)-N(3))-methyltransferase RlmH [Algicella marina]|uniref:Ribosomal RNA large subunit methyltransferase H n=1 Tax=Algicella marina TaxID=2683284 RepID=A0A6P1T322_9RHOB|nr:23S rRNA (pseudouridine(1915)-N(3))-methyltransferase RlmH [Algicella marina]QHQ36145.1 23S rRNA (pseudouridine(1915)-N(3))-methyltransferase RlmH [Algicella marina]